MTLTATPFFQYAYGVDSTSITVPSLSLSTTGTLSYQYGYTENYEQDLLTVSTALPIPRNLTNGLYYDITYAIQQLQTNGASLWVDPADGGPLTNYPIYAQVQHSYSSGPAYIWESAVASNAVEPGVDVTWRVVSGAGRTLNSNVPFSPGIAVGSGTPTNVTSITLPTGKWLLMGNINYSFSGTTNPQVIGGISPTSATLPDTSLCLQDQNFTAGASGGQGGSVGSQIVTVASGTQTYYLVGIATYSGGSSNTLCGNLSAISISAATS